MNNMGIILPTFLSIIRTQDKWRGQYVAQKDGDHTAWDAAFVFGLLERFFEITGAFSLLDMQSGSVMTRYRADCTPLQHALEPLCTLSDSVHIPTINNKSSRCSVPSRATTSHAQALGASV